MPVYAVGQGHVDDREKLDEYLAKIGNILPPEARVLAIDETPEVVEGPVTHPRTVVIEFPSREDFRAWYESAAHQTVLPLRQEAVSGTLVLAKGFLPPSGD